MQEGRQYKNAPLQNDHPFECKLKENNKERHDSQVAAWCCPTERCIILPTLRRQWWNDEKVKSEQNTWSVV
jgi:hypothetical protein